METIFFYITFIILIFSSIGHGIIFGKFFNIKADLNIGTYGLLGLANLTLISYISVFFFEDKSYFNLGLLILGISYFFNNLKNVNIKKYEILVILLLSIAIFISKTHDDFPFYHLQQSLNFSLNKIYIGLHNLDFFYSYHSSILYLNSIFYLPYFKYNLFNFPNLFVLIFFTLTFINYIFKKKNINLIKYFCLFALIFVVTKFSRLSEYGTDLAGQLVVTVSIFYLLKIFYSKKIDISEIKIISFLIIFSITIKTYFIFYLFLILLTIFTLSYKNSLIFIKSNKFFVLYLFSFISFFFILNILTSGCLVFPLAETCFTNLTWSMPLNEVNNYNKWFEAWSKSLAGTGYITENYTMFLSDLSWIKIWLNNYFNKYFETILLLLFISIILILSFRPYKIQLKLSRNYLYLIIFLFLILIFWFLKHPTLRYGGYVIHYSLFSLIISLIISNTLLQKEVINRRIKFLIILSLIIFVGKNINRINFELNREGEYNYNNFPYFYNKMVQYERIDLGNNIFVTFVNSDVCWSSPPPCGGNKNLVGEFKMGYKVINRKK